MDVRQQYPFVFFLTIDRESMERCFLYACYGNPYLFQNSGKAYRQHATFYTDQFVVYEGVIPGAQHRVLHWPTGWISRKPSISSTSCDSSSIEPTGYVMTGRQVCAPEAMTFLTGTADQER